MDDIKVETVKSKFSLVDLVGNDSWKIYENKQVHKRPVVADDEGNISVMFTLPEKIGSLATALKIFEKHRVNLYHIESRPAHNDITSFEFCIVCDNQTGSLNDAIEDLKTLTNKLTLLSRNSKSGRSGDEVPWFPRRIKELDKFVNQTLDTGAELEFDHPAFTDAVYRERRKEFVDVANSYRCGQPIPYIEYTSSEKKIWGTIFKELVRLYPKHACREFNHIFPLLVENCGYREDNIPQLQDVSDFLIDCTGFSLRPVAGVLSPRDFMAGLALRVFHATQYIRHGSMCMFTPEPDTCHVLLGHVPLLADQSFAQFSQEIGLASLGASDEVIKKLATLYWFTMEFGLCRQDGQLKAYGAMLLSSFGELQHGLSDKPEIRTFDPVRTCQQDHALASFQPVYYVSESIDEATEKFREFAATIPRPFSVRYNPYTQSVEVITTKEQIIDLTSDIMVDFSLLQDALAKVQI